VLARWALESMLFMIRLFWLDPRKQHYCPAFRAGRTQTSIGLGRGRLKMCHRTPPGSKRLSRMGCPFIVYRNRTCAARSCKPTTDIPLKVRVYGQTSEYGLQRSAPTSPRTDDVLSFVPLAISPFLRHRRRFFFCTGIGALPTSRSLICVTI